MAAMCRFWRFAPRDYWALTYGEHQALTAYMDAERRYQEREAKKARQRAKRKR